MNPGRMWLRSHEFWWACRRWHVPPSGYLLVVATLRQKVFLYERQLRCERTTQWGYILRRQFRASTSRFGLGQVSGSNQTPLGLHRIAEKIGGGQPVGTVFESRRAVGLISAGRTDAAIAHRIFWLEGLEPGFNRGAAVDTHARYIYFHGLADEPSLGRPASRGCIHLASADLMPLYDQIPSGTLVWITARS